MAYKIVPAPTSTTSPTIPGASLETDSQILSGVDFNLVHWFMNSGILEFLSALWTWFAVLAYLVSILLLVLYVVASVRRNLYIGLMTQELRDAEQLYDEMYRGAPRNNRMHEVLNHASSSNPSDWRLAIIEADIILDEVLEERGYAGSSLGERLKGITAAQLATIEDAWEAHKVRNRIAHSGSDFILTKRIAQEAVVRYQRVFDELGVS